MIKFALIILLLGSCSYKQQSEHLEQENINNFQDHIPDNYNCDSFKPIDNECRSSKAVSDLGIRKIYLWNANKEMSELKVVDLTGISGKSLQSKYIHSSVSGFTASISIKRDQVTVFHRGKSISICKENNFIYPQNSIENEAMAIAYAIKTSYKAFISKTKKIIDLKYGNDLRVKLIVQPCVKDLDKKNETDYSFIVDQASFSTVEKNSSYAKILNFHRFINIYPNVSMVGKGRGSIGQNSQIVSHEWGHSYFNAFEIFPTKHTTLNKKGNFFKFILRALEEGVVDLVSYYSIKEPLDLPGRNVHKPKNILNKNYMNLFKDNPESYHDLGSIIAALLEKIFTLKSQNNIDEKKNHFINLLFQIKTKLEKTGIHQFKETPWKSLTQIIKQGIKTGEFENQRDQLYLCYLLKNSVPGLNPCINNKWLQLP